MKIKTHEAHDRLQHFQNQQEKMSQGIQDCIKNVPDSIKSPFYVLAHSRMVDIDEKVDLMCKGVDIIPDERFIFQPRITKPKSSSNSYLFLCQKNTDIIQIIWMIPKIEYWEMYEPGKMTHNDIIWESIQNYKNKREQLNAPDPDGPTQKDELNWKFIMSEEARRRKIENKNHEMMERLYAKRKI